jgi:hypothetical protein
MKISKKDGKEIQLKNEDGEKNPKYFSDFN